MVHRRDVEWKSRELLTSLTPLEQVDLCEAAIREDVITLIHFNDVYNLEPTRTSDGQSAGASRFVALVKRLRRELPDAMVLFSGDVFNPSVSTLPVACAACESLACCTPDQTLLSVVQ